MSLKNNQSLTDSHEPNEKNRDIAIATNSEPIDLQSNGASPLVNYSKFRADPRFSGINGKGYSVAVIDTGIDPNHPFFGADKNKNGIADRIIAQYDFADGDANASDRNGHGSHVSSVIASSDRQYPGIAPGANLISLKVFKDSGSSSFSYVEQALQWVVANASKYNIASVNLSFTDGNNYNSPVQQYGLGDEIAALAKKKVAVVAAVGNNFAKYKSAQGVGYPAADPNVISVGAVYSENIGSQSYSNDASANSTGADRLVPFSQRHRTLTSIFAPGAPITGANANGGTMTLQGTSQAAPHVAGAIALAQQLAVRELGRRLTVPELEQLLASTGKPIVDGDNEKDNVANTGLTFKRLDIQALGAAILKKKTTNQPASENGTAIGEYGKVASADSNVQTIQLDRSYTNPVVFVSPLSHNGSDPAVVRLTDVQSDRFSVYVQEPSYADGKHIAESFSYVVLEAGNWQLEDGTRLEVGNVDTKAIANQSWTNVNFQNSFNDSPVILSQVQTNNESDLVYTRQRNATAGGFQLAMQEEEARLPTGHASETVGWMAIASGSGSWNGNAYQSGKTGDRMTHDWTSVNFNPAFSQAPQLLASIGTFDGDNPAGLRYQNLSANSANLKIEEEQSLDAEVAHLNENIDFLAIEGSGTLTANPYEPSSNASAAGMGNSLETTFQPEPLVS